MAEQKLVKAWQLNPNIPYLKSCLAEICFNRGNFRLAAQLAHQELQRMPNDPRANMVLGLSLVQQGIFSDSVPYLYKACAAMPDRSDLDDKASFFLAWNGRYADALAPTLCCIALTSGQYGSNAKLVKRLDDCLHHTPRRKLSTLSMRSLPNFHPQALIMLTSAPSQSLLPLEVGIRKPEHRFNEPSNSRKKMAYKTAFRISTWVESMKHTPMIILARSSFTGSPNS